MSGFEVVGAPSLSAAADKDGAFDVILERSYNAQIGSSNKEPRPRCCEDGAPKVQNLNSEWTYGSSISGNKQGLLRGRRRKGGPSALEMENVRRLSLFSEFLMKVETRDNLIYLGVGLGMAVLVAADFSYADTHGQKMWWPSRFAFRALYTTLLLAYFVARETRKLKATLAQMLAYILLASFVHLTTVVTFRQAVGELSGITFAGLAVFEMFVVFQLLMVVVRYLTSRSQPDMRKPH